MSQRVGGSAAGHGYRGGAVRAYLALALDEHRLTHGHIIKATEAVLSRRVLGGELVGRLGRAELPVDGGAIRHRQLALAHEPGDELGDGGGLVDHLVRVVHLHERAIFCNEGGMRQQEWASQ